jgi:hypothetical protein
MIDYDPIERVLLDKIQSCIRASQKFGNQKRFARSEKELHKLNHKIRVIRTKRLAFQEILRDIQKLVKHDSNN